MARSSKVSTALSSLRASAVPYITVLGQATASASAGGVEELSLSHCHIFLVAWIVLAVGEHHSFGKPRAQDELCTPRTQPTSERRGR